MAVTVDADVPRTTAKTVPKIGELLLARNAISQEQLNAAIARQQTDKRLLGEILLEHNAVSPRQLRRSLSWQQWLRQAMKVASLGLVTLQAVEAKEWANAAIGDVDGVQASQTHFDAWDALQSVESSSQRTSQDASTNEYRKSRRKFETYLKDAIGEPAYILLKGRYSGKADSIVEGLRYTVRWRTDSVNVEFKYTF